MANDIIDINVYETVETVEITVNPNLTTVNINKVTGGGGGGSQDLQSVTDIGATTTNTIIANSITTTIDSTINGVRVGRGNISGTVSENTAVGYQALQSVIHTTGSTGYYNTAIGEGALKSLTSGYANDAFGDAALNKCTTGTFNLAIGTSAMLNSTTSTINTAIGQYTLRDNISGSKNTAVGNSALMQNTGSFNTAIGSYAGGGVSSTGTENILIGYQAGSSISSGRNNLLIENQSGGSIGTGSYNIILNPKQRSGVTTGSNNTIIGCFNNTFAAGLTSNVIIGNGLGAIIFQSTDTGLTTVPAQTNTLINGDASGKAVVTKEYVASVIGSGGGISNATASGTDTYTATISGIASYVDGAAYLIRFTNGNTTGATLNINGLGAIALYRNNDGALIGGDIQNGGEMLCVYNSTITAFQCIGTSPNDIVSYVTNADSVTITKGMPVYAFGGTGDRMTVKRAYNTLDSTSAQTVGLVMSTSIAAGQKGLIITQGLLYGLSTLPTSTFADGDTIYLGSTAGTITNIKPYAPNHLVYLGVVTTASAGAAGRMYVKVQNGYELDELHNVQAQNPTLKDTLWYDNTVSPAQWKTASIPTILGYTPYNATNPSGYQTSAQVQTIADAKVVQTITNGVTATAPSQDAVFDALALKQDTLQNTVNIKSINGNSILGSGDLTISGTGISSLNGLTGATQTFSTTTTTGTGIPAWSSSGTNHQLNIPIAGGATTTGLITGTSQSISGSKQFLSNPEIPVPAGNSGPCIVLGSTGGGGATGTLSIGDTTTYPNGQEMQSVKGVTSPIQTQLDGKQPTLTAGNGINIITNTISTVDTSRAAYTMLANNTNASAIPTAQVYKDIAEQTYSLSPTFTVTAPTTIVANTYKWNQVGSSVNVRVNLSYTTAGSFTTVVIPLPTDMPTPLSPTGFTAASDILYYGTGSFTTTTSTAANLARVTFLRRNAANNGYEFVMLYSTAIAARVVTLTLQYFT